MPGPGPPQGRFGGVSNRVVRYSFFFFSRQGALRNILNLSRELPYVVGLREELLSRSAEIIVIYGVGAEWELPLELSFCFNDIDPDIDGSPMCCYFCFFFFW